MSIQKEVQLEHSRQQLWAKLADVWIAELYLVSKGVIEPSKELVQVMANTIMGELLVKGLTSHEEMIKKFRNEV